MSLDIWLTANFLELQSWDTSSRCISPLNVLSNLSNVSTLASNGGVLTAVVNSWGRAFPWDLGTHLRQTGQICVRKISIHTKKQKCRELLH